MKLAKIRHIRCNEWSATTYMMAPDAWDDDRLQGAIEKAQGAYLAEVAKAIEDVKAGLHPSVPYRPEYERYPDKTVREVKEEWQRAKDAEAKRVAALKDTRRGFAAFLHDQGLEYLHEANELDADADWHHRHGMKLDYYEDDPNGEWPTPAEVAKIIADRDDF